VYTELSLCMLMLITGTVSNLKFENICQKMVLAKFVRKLAIFVEVFAKIFVNRGIFM
jgi:phage-related holin